MDALPAWAGAAGTAAVEQDSDGRRWLVVDVEAQAPSGASQVWLIDNNVVGMNSLGFLSDGHARLVIPDSLDLDQFPVVDVSAEPANDADPRHSGTRSSAGSWTSSQPHFLDQRGCGGEEPGATGSYFAPAGEGGRMQKIATISEPT